MHDKNAFKADILHTFSLLTLAHLPKRMEDGIEQPVTCIFINHSLYQFFIFKVKVHYSGLTDVGWPKGAQAFEAQRRRLSDFVEIDIFVLKAKVVPYTFVRRGVPVTEDAYPEPSACEVGWPVPFLAACGLSMKSML